MVLVSYILDNYSSILQTQFSHREGHEARRIGLEAMPLDQHIESHHGAREPSVEIRPHAVHDPLAMANHGRSISSSLSKVAGGVHRHEKGSKRLASLQAMSPATARRYTAPPPDCTHYKV